MQTEQQPSTSSRAIATCMACLCAIALIWSAAPLAQAKSKESDSVTAHKPRKPPKIKMENHSGENTAERDRRLLRECKGRPNAGACLGYAS